MNFSAIYYYYYSRLGVLVRPSPPPSPPFSVSPCSHPSHPQKGTALKAIAFLWSFSFSSLPVQYPPLSSLVLRGCLLSLSFHIKSFIGLWFVRVCRRWLRVSCVCVCVCYSRSLASLSKLETLHETAKNTTINTEAAATKSFGRVLLRIDLSPTLCALCLSPSV